MTTYYGTIQIPEPDLRKIRVYLVIDPPIINLELNWEEGEQLTAEEREKEINIGNDQTMILRDFVILEIMPTQQYKNYSAD